MAYWYQRELYVDRVQKIKTSMPKACIGVDVIVGFPGETEEDFIETYNFLNELNISYLHVFTYSERPNTSAIEMANVVPNKERSKRSKMLRSLSEKKRRYFYNQFTGKTMNVLFEKDIEGGKIHGFTENYIRVAVNYSPEYINKIISINLIEVGANGIMRGELAASEVSIP